MKKLLLLLSMLISTPAMAATDNDWKISWTPYIWAANIGADVTVNDRVSGSGELDFDDLLDKVDGAFMHYLHARKGEWGIVNEIIYLDISDSIEPDGTLVDRVEAGLTEGIIDLAASYSPNQIDNTIFFVGLRRIDVDIDLDIEGQLADSRSREEDWTNLLLGIQYLIPVEKNWLIGLKADYASDFGDETSYILTLGADYIMTDLLSLKFGYRSAKIEFESSDFKLNQTTDGTYLGLSFNW